jgi:hypothetical protein
VPHHPELFGLIAEFETSEALLAAARRCRAEGYTRMDAYSPFPVEGLAGATGFHERWLPYFALAVGGVGGYLMQWWLNALDHPINVGGRPLNAWPAFAVGGFELMVLGAVLALLIGMLALNGLPRLYHRSSTPSASSAPRSIASFCWSRARIPASRGTGCRLCSNGSGRYRWRRCRPEGTAGAGSAAADARRLRGREMEDQEKYEIYEARHCSPTAAPCGIRCPALSPAAIRPFGPSCARGRR